MLYRNVIVEKDDKDIVIPFRAIPVFVDFDPSRKVGKAYVFKDQDNNMIADLIIRESLPDTILWPAIGYKMEHYFDNKPDLKTLTAIGLCTMTNLDKTILCLDYLNDENYGK